MRPTIVMIAPVAPFRGGVAQHSTMLANALAKISDLRVFSYKRLYPKLLYPGGEQKDECGRLTCDARPEFVLDSLNPLTWFRVVRRIKTAGARTVIVPWWTFFLAPCYFVIGRLLGRNGIKVIFVCHNYTDHEAAWWKRRLSRLVLKSGDGFVMHARSVRRDLEADLGMRACLVMPMPIYADYPLPITVLERRASLELLFFGFVRKYKGLDILLHALAALERQDWFLSVVGECWTDADEYRVMAEKLGISGKVEFVFRYVTDEQAAAYIDRADVLVLPYRTATGSAVIPLAYHYNKPVVVTPVGGLPEVVEHGRTGHVVAGASPEALTDVLATLDKEGLEGLSSGIDEWKRTNSWERLADKMLRWVQQPENRDSHG